MSKKRTASISSKVWIHLTWLGTVIGGLSYYALFAVASRLYSPLAFVYTWAPLIIIIESVMVIIAVLAILKTRRWLIPIVCVAVDLIILALTTFAYLFRGMTF